MSRRNAHPKGKGLVTIIMISLVVSLLPLGTYAAGNSDIKGHWAEETIEKWLAMGLAVGYPDGTFFVSPTVSNQLSQPIRLPPPTIPLM